MINIVFALAELCERFKPHMSLSVRTVHFYQEVHLLMITFDNKYMTKWNVNEFKTFP